MWEYRFGPDVGVSPKEAPVEGAEGTLHLRLEDGDGAVPFGDAARLRKIKEPKELDAELNVFEGQAELRFGPDVPAEIHERESVNRIEISIIIIDGEEWTGPTTEAKEMIGTLEVETIEVISGTRAVEIYGARAAEGVIVVTTKKD